MYLLAYNHNSLFLFSLKWTGCMLKFRGFKKEVVCQKLETFSMQIWWNLMKQRIFGVFCKNPGGNQPFLFKIQPCDPQFLFLISHQGTNRRFCAKNQKLLVCSFGGKKVLPNLVKQRIFGVFCKNLGETSHFCSKFSLVTPNFYS